MKHHVFREASQSRAGIIVRQRSAGKVQILQRDPDQGVFEDPARRERVPEVATHGLHVFDDR